MLIRKAKMGDFNSLVNLYKQLFDSEKIFDDNLVDEYKLDDKQENIIKKRIRSRKWIFLVAEVDNLVVGLIDGYLIDADCYKEKIAYLYHVCVDEKYRNKGVGTKLIEEFSNISKDKGAKYIKLNAFENNKEAINLYKKIGFKEYSLYYVNRIDNDC